MKKLKTALLLLFALVMSLCLFACGGGEDPDDQTGGGGDEDKISRVRITGVKDLTDSADDAAIQAMLNGIKITANMRSGETKELGVGDCDVTGTIPAHKVGEYRLTLKPKENNPDNRSGEITVKIDHDWEEVAGGKSCKYDKASLTVTEEDVVLHYGDFHVGTNLTSAYTDAAAKAGWTETQPYTNNKSVSNIRAFGSVNGKVVPTVTAGSLEPGMKITIRGTAKTATGDASPWTVSGAPKTNEQWNYPSIGIADPFSKVTNAAHPQYVGNGVSVIVRQEGWVLYDGIGKGDANVLGGIMGGQYTSANGWRNFGSHNTETETTTPGDNATGYVPGQIPTDWSTVGDWWVYSEGQEMHSGDYYNVAEGDPAKDIEYSWYYNADNKVIELTYTYDYKAASAVSLKAYIKVPDLDEGYTYETIIHGDYNDMTITESEVIALNTPKEGGFTYGGLKSGAKAVYAENDVFDASTLSLTVEYDQKPGVQNEVRLNNNQIYAYTGEKSLDQLKQDADTLNGLDDWVSLGEKNLSLKNNILKIHLNKGGVTYVHLLNNDDGSLPFTIKPNKVESAVGADVTVGGTLFANNGKLGAFTYAFDGTNAVLTLADASYVQTTSADQKSKLSDAAKYIALRINGTTLDTQAEFSAANVTATAGGASVPCQVVVDGTDAYVVLGLTSNADVTITGLQATPVVVKLAQLVGFNVESSIVYGTGWELNKGGSVTLTYTLADKPAADTLQIRRGSTPVRVADLVDESGNSKVAASGRAFGSGATITEATYKEGVLTVKATFGAASYTNYAPIEISLFVDGVSQCRDTIDYKMAVASDAENWIDAADGKHHAYASSATVLNVVAAYDVDDLADGKISGSFTLNINNGDEANFKTYGLLEIHYAIVGGSLVITNPPDGVTGVATLRGTYGDSRDKDLGAFVVISIDVTKRGIASGDYYVEFLGSATFSTTPPTSISKVSGTTITDYAISAGSTELVSTADGTCYVEGLYAHAVKADGKVVCYAGVAAAGGEHIDANNDHKCDLCGGTMADNTSLGAGTWFPAGHPSIDIHDGDVITFTGKYADNIAEAGFGSVLGIFIEEADGQGWDIDGNDENTNGTWHTTQDGYAVWTNFNWTTDSRFPYAPAVEAYEHATDGYERFTSSVITADHPYNTGNGWVNAYGTTIDENNFNEAKQGGTFRFIVIRENGVITTTAQLWAPTMAAFHSEPFFEYTTTVKVDPNAGRQTVKIFGKQQLNNVVKLVEDKIVVTQSKIANTVISAVESAQVDSHAAPASVIYTTAGTADGYAVVNASGVAGKEGNTYYVSFKIDLAQQLASTTTAAVLGPNGQAIQNAKAVIAENKQSIEVYIPLGSVDYAVIDLTNYEGSTLQSDIKVNLSDVALSTVTATETLTDVNIGAGTFTIKYSGGVQATDSIAVGGVSKTLTELATKTALGDGISAQAGSVASGEVTVTFEKTAADLTKAVIVPEIRLERDGKLLYLTTLTAALNVTGTELDASGWYAIAEGTKLTLVTNTQKDNSELLISVNAGAKTDKALLAVSNLAFKVSGSTVAFENASVLSKVATTAYTENPEKYLVAIVLDLTTLGVQADTVYGVALESSSATHYYTVNAQRTLEQSTKASGSKTAVATATCTTDGISAYMVGDNAQSATFFYGIEVTKGAHKFPAEGGLCETCQEVTGWTNQVTVGKADNSVAFTIADGTNSAYNPTGKFGSIVQGQVVTAVGHTTSSAANNYNGFAMLLYPGENSEWVDGTHFRIDNWVNAGNGDQTELPAYSWNLKKTPTLNGGEVNWDTMRQILANGEATVVWDWTDAKKIVITATVVGISTQGTYQDVYEITSATADGNFLRPKFSIGLAPDGGSFIGTITATASKDVVAAENCNPDKACTHSWNTATHKCDWCSAFNPDASYHNSNGGTFQNGICSVCGWEDESQHTHSYTKGVCDCGEACRHVWNSDTCTQCGATKTTVNKTVDDSSYWTNGNVLIDLATLTEGDTQIVATATYTSFTAAEWAGAIVGITTTGGTYAIRYIDGAFVGSEGAWNTAYGSEVVNAAAEGTTWVHNTHDNASLPGSLFRLVVSYKAGVVTVRVEKFAATDTNYATVLATRVLTISGVSGDITIGLSSADGSAFTDNQVAVHTVSWAE